MKGIQEMLRKNSPIFLIKRGYRKPEPGCGHKAKINTGRNIEYV